MPYYPSWGYTRKQKYRGNQEAVLPHNQEAWLPQNSGIPEAILDQKAGSHRIQDFHTSEDSWRNSRSSLSSLGRKLPQHSGPEGWLQHKGGGEERRQGHSAVAPLVLGLVLLPPWAPIPNSPEIVLWRFSSSEVVLEVQLYSIRRDRTLSHT
jgi:hypothetical protein